MPLAYNPGKELHPLKLSILDMHGYQVRIERDYQLVAMSNHRANNTERAIHTFKVHFLEGLFILDKDFHLKFWYRFLQQATISINFLRKSIILPRLSDFTHIFG